MCILSPAEYKSEMDFMWNAFDCQVIPRFPQCVTHDAAAQTAALRSTVRCHAHSPVSIQFLLPESSGVGCLLNPYNGARSRKCRDYALKAWKSHVLNSANTHYSYP